MYLSGLSKLIADHKYMYKTLPVIFFVGVCIVFSCNNNQAENDEVINPEALFFDYKIIGAEGDDNLTVMLQYKIGSIEGDAITIEKQGKVLLDGERLHADSAGLTGTFYELYKPIAAFTGKHRIDFFPDQQNKYTEEFDFKPFSLISPIHNKYSRNDLVFDFNELKNGEIVRILMTDTSFASDDINRLDTVKNGQIIVTGKELENLVNGPVQLEFINEYEKTINKGIKTRGRLSIAYSIRRNFLLGEEDKANNLSPSH